MVSWARRSRTGLVPLAAMAVLVFTGPVVGAQDPERPAGWLGVRVTQNYVCTWVDDDTEGECDLVLDISEVQEGGPAHAGGLQPGDRMIAINGQDLTFQTWDPLRESIQAGTPVSIDVMRDDARYFARVTPGVRSRSSEVGDWLGTSPRARRVARAGRPSVFVVTLTELDRREGGSAFAITVRDNEDEGVEFEPAALHVTNGRLRLVPISEGVAVDIPELRREIVGTLRGITDSSYERAANAVQVVEGIRSRLPSDAELRERLTRIAQVGLEEIRLATTFRRSWAGAQFVSAGPGLATAVEADSEGLLVVRVIRNTPADRLGLREGDVVFEAGGEPVREVGELVQIVDSAEGPVEIRWNRKGREMSGTTRRR